MKMFARACDLTHMNQFHPSDITTCIKQMTELRKIKSVK